MTNRIFFFEWIIKTLIPYVNGQRLKYNNLNQHAVLILDNCAVHLGDNIEDTLVSNGIFAVPLPPYSSHKTQMLDVGIFGNVKVNQQRIHHSNDLSKQSQQIIKLLGSWQATTHPMAVVKSFNECGVDVGSPLHN